jgi:hypothetical protein
VFCWINDDKIPGDKMKNVIEEIFSDVFDQQEIVNAVNMNLQPVLHGRKAGDNGDEYFRKLSFCLGYHIRKVEILKSIIFTFFKHNVIRKNLDKNQIAANVDGIISSDKDMNELIETAHAFIDKASFNSQDQRDASYLMSCMKLIIKACLLVNFIEYVSNRKHKSFLASSYDKLTEMFDNALDRHAAKAFMEIMKAM